MLRIMLARIEIGLGCLTGLHVHLRRIEIYYIVQGKVLVGFIETRENKLFSQKLEPIFGF